VPAGAGGALAGRTEAELICAALWISVALLVDQQNEQVVKRILQPAAQDAVLCLWSSGALRRQPRRRT